MGEALTNLAKKALAILVLAIAAYLLFELIVGFVSAIAWVVIAILALAAVVWAVRTL